MSIRFFSLHVSAAPALAAGILVGCTQDAPIPAGPSVALAVVAGADHGGRPLSTDMTQEVTTIPEWQGDPDGSGTALITLNEGQSEVCWDLSVSNITLPATASHIHAAPPGVRGAIVVFLSAPNATGAAVGCTSGVDRDLIRDILQDPESYYVNVHTTDFPPGAVRGQLPRSQ
jgi:CHRD domain